MAEFTVCVWHDCSTTKCIASEATGRKMKGVKFWFVHFRPLESLHSFTMKCVYAM